MFYGRLKNKFRVLLKAAGGIRIRDLKQAARLIQGSSTKNTPSYYSRVPNECVGWNTYVGGKCSAITIDM